MGGLTAANLQKPSLLRIQVCINVDLGCDVASDEEGEGENTMD
eukprot:COSAG01_NODE_29145_length_644_cov_1.317431_1_plen_42_part_10